MCLSNTAQSKLYGHKLIYPSRIYSSESSEDTTSTELSTK